jgi:group I intron endonuclease
MTGIYKITNPNGKIYIGQSIDIERRWWRYNNNLSSTKGQTKLYNSINKYGADVHTFEVIEECNEKDLNKRERYYQEKYNAIEEGLNCRYTETNDKSGRLSVETKKKMSKIRKGRKLTDEWKQNLGKSISGENNGMYGKTHSDETRKKISKKLTQSWKDKPREEVDAHNKRHSERMSGDGNPMYGKTHTDATKNKQKQRAKGRYTLEWYIERNGEQEGKRLYKERKKRLSESSRKMWMKRKGLV